MVVQGPHFPYQINKSTRAKRVSLRVKNDGTVILVVPRRVPNYVAEKFLLDKSSWVLASLHKVSRYSPLPKTSLKEGKEKALAFVHARLKHFNKTYQYQYKKVSVRAQKTKWGSCSARGNLNFNYKIVHLPEPLANYLIVHELCHLKNMNHGGAFWHDVARTIPDYPKRKHELRKFVL